MVSYAWGGATEILGGGGGAFVPLRPPGLNPAYYGHTVYVSDLSTECCERVELGFIL